MSKTHILAIDQGTTSTRAIVFDDKLVMVASDQSEFPQHFPHAGWVEHDPGDIWRGVVSTSRSALAAAGLQASDLASLGIANQRETIVVWSRKTGAPLHNAIVWQDRRTADLCKRLRAQGVEPTFTEKTGLLLDPYFCGTKLAWLLDAVEGARAAATRGELAFGTVDTFLIWRLTGGRVHATDATNASRTLLFNIHSGQWDDELLSILGIPLAMLPEVKDCADNYGLTDPAILGAAVPIGGVAGDQQAATIGQACFRPGMVKSTYGTGCFALLNTGPRAVKSQTRLLTTIAYQLEGRRTYALEGSIFVAGAAVQWLRDGLKLIAAASEAGDKAMAADPEPSVILVPAFVGLGAPYWNAEVRGAIFGLTRGTTGDDLCRAALEAVCYQTRDLVEAMRQDWGPGADETVLRVDGGMAASDWTMQCLADILAAPVDRPSSLETTALGAAYLAGLAAGLQPPPDVFAERWERERRFTPMLPADVREKKYLLWKGAVRKLLA